MQHFRRRLPDRDDRRRVGVEGAAVLDQHFANLSAHPRDLANAFHDVDVPIGPNDHINAAACRADADRVRETGRWLDRHATDRCATTIGLALLTTVDNEADIPLIRTIGLLSDRFAPLTARALERRTGGGRTLMWLAERVAGWGRVHVVESRCRTAGP